MFQIIFISRDRRELEFREMERHKEMDRDRIERERQQERERLDKQCNAEQAVTKHFEESLRRAKEKVCSVVDFKFFLPHCRIFRF